MSDLANTIWREFEAEAEEHLHLIGTILTSGTQGQAEAVAQLFRSFHSLKGLSRVLGLGAMETTAHHAENVLGLVRDGRLALDDDIVTVLLQAADALTAQRDHAIATHTDLQADPALLALLESVASGAGAGAAEATAPAPVSDAADLGFDDDGEMLGFYVEAMHDHLPVLAWVGAAEFGGKRDDVTEALESLRHGAGLLELSGLAEELGLLADQVMEGAAPEEMAATLLRITEQAATLGDVTGFDPGVETLAREFATLTQDSLANALAALDAACQSGADLARHADAAHVLLRLCGKVAGANLALTLADTGRRLVADAVPSTAAMRHALEAAAALLADSLGMPSASDAAAAKEALQVAIALGDEAAPSGAIGTLQIRRELAEILLPENVAAIEAAMEAGQRIYTVIAFPERDRETGGRFVRWLTSAVRLITNRTVLEGAESGFEFLLLSDLDPAALKLSLTEVDSSGRCVVEAMEHGPGASQRLLPDAVVAPPKTTAPPAAAPTMRVPAGIITSLIDEVGEMMTQVSGLSALMRASSHDDALTGLARYAAEAPAEVAEVLRPLVDALTESRRQLHNISDTIVRSMGRLGDTALELRVVPIESLFARLGRSVRDLAAHHGKLVRFTVEDAMVRVDKVIVERLADPLMHMVRNSVDHGIELPADRVAAGKPDRAEVWVRATQRGAEVVIEIGDDGRGLDTHRIRATAIKRGVVDAHEAERLSEAEIMRLIFRPGFSTAEQITETSGRGVGMDVVLTTVHGLGGDIDIRSELGKGTVFHLHLPLSAAIQAAIMVEAGGQTFAVPDRHVDELRQPDPALIRPSPVGARLMLRGESLPLHSLTKLLSLGEPGELGRHPVVVMTAGSGRMALEVDALHGRRDMYLKDLHPRLAKVPGIGGAAVQADGSVTLVLDGDGLMKLARRHETRELANAAVP